MASSIRLSNKQLPHIYKHLPPICEKFGIEEPEFYLQMDPNPNAWTFGDTRIFVTVTSGLLEMMNDEELDAILGHECGHILCHHVLYHTIARWLSSGLSSMGLLGAVAIPIQYALYYWSRKSELSADRAASIITSPEIVASTMARLSGGPKSITSQIDLQEWAKQADEYDQIQNDGLWNKALQLTMNGSSVVTVDINYKYGGNNMFFNEQGIIDIDELIAKQSSFQKIMDDGIVTDEELQEQSQRVISLLHEADKRFNESDLQFIKMLFAETNVLSAIYHYYEHQSLK